MADPTPYTVSYNFSDFQEDHPRTPLPADRVDIEYANIETALGSQRNAIKNVRRSDGALKNAIVTWDSLSPAVKALFGNIGPIPETLDHIPILTEEVDFTITDDQNGALILIDSDTPVTVTVPNDTEEGFYALFAQIGEAPFEFAAASGATLVNKYNWFASETQWAVLSLVVISNDDSVSAQALIAGDVSP
jgi:hypothetical protein